MSVIEEGRRVLKIEAQAVSELQEQINDNFAKIVEKFVHCEGKVIITGMGKSGHVARKMAATLSSTGTPSVFLHPAESSHGDLGVVGNKDLVFVISYGGGSNELVPVISHCARKGIPLIGMTGNPESKLALSSDLFINVRVSEEACPLGLAPTASSTASLAMADAIAMAVLKQKGFKEEDFAEFHPGGSLGRKLLTRVKDVMHEGDALPVVTEDTSMKDVISSMTGKEVRGVTGVVDSKGGLIGVITDGDIRRTIEKTSEIMQLRAKDLMSMHPKTISSDELAERALFLMEQFKIQTLFVVESDNGLPKPLGILHLQDLISAQLR